MDVPEGISALLRFSVYVFLRRVPGHVFPVAIATIFALYATSWYYTKPVEKGAARTLIVGGRDPKNKATSIAAFATNIALFAMSLDMVFRPAYLHPATDLSFIRLGYVSHEEARFLIREPDQAKLPVTIQLCVLDSEPEDCATSIPALETTEETDFTAVIPARFFGKTQRTYTWTSSNGHNGTVTSAPTPGVMPADGKFTFLSTSCMVNNFPYNPIAHPLSIPGARYLADLLPTLKAQFMFFVGDFIYIDVPHRFGSTVEDYRKKYRQAYASPDMPALMSSLPWFHVIDDHEIANDWSNGTAGVYTAAVDPYVHYHVAANPPPVPVSDEDTESVDSVMNGGRMEKTWFEFVQGPASFFMLDTRTYRSANDAEDNENKTFLGATQLQDFMDWLEHPEVEGVRWKIVASSVPFTKNWPVNRQDTWGGFLTERQKVLEKMWEANGRGYGVVVLSGDRHEFAATRFVKPAAEGEEVEGETVVYEFSTSPLNQFASPVATYKEDTEGTDVKLGYIHAGNSKVGVVSIFEEVLPAPIAAPRVVVVEGQDGEEAQEVIVEDVGLGSLERKSALQFRVFIEGIEAWNTTVYAPERKVKEGGGGEGLTGLLDGDVAGTLWDWARQLFS